MSQQQAYIFSLFRSHIFVLEQTCSWNQSTKHTKQDLDLNKSFSFLMVPWYWLFTWLWMFYHVYWYTWWMSTTTFQPFHIDPKHFFKEITITFLQRSNLMAVHLFQKHYYWCSCSCGFYAIIFAITNFYKLILARHTQIQVQFLNI